MTVDGPSRFKSRFSLLSLFPSRHPPLVISHPMPQTQPVPHYPTIISQPISPVYSHYPSPSTPPSPIKEHKTRQTPSPRRPPPLDLNKTRELYPAAPAQNWPDIPASTNLPDPGRAPRKPKERKVKDDPFEVAEVEPGHRYTSWKGGQVDIEPGQVIPPSLLRIPDGTPTLRSSREPNTPDQYESVLHNVLLTPTYLDASPLPVPSPSPSYTASSTHNHRRTLVDRATDTIHSVARMSRSSKWIGKGISKNTEADVGRSLKEMREREEREMDRFRREVRPGRLRLSSVGNGRSYTPVSERNQAYQRKSPANREWNIGTKADHRDRKGESIWRGAKKQEETLKGRQRIWRFAIIGIILCLAALTIGLCTSLLTKSSKPKAATASASSEPSTTSSSASSSSSTLTSPRSASQPRPTSQSITTCLDLFTSSAPTKPLAYPCSDCTPLLTSTTNDFVAPLVDGNSSGVGSALQFCALMDVYRACNTGSGLGGAGWMKNASPCGGWDGVTCDSRGRAIGLRLQYPNVPDVLPKTLDNLVSLQSFYISGNTSVPAGVFPSGLLSLPDLMILDAQYTALTGPISSIDFGQARELTSLNLVNNQQLGTTLPSLSGNARLLTLTVTGQGLNAVSEDALPSSLTYLDLSFNSLSGAIPSFGPFNALNTLYLQNNDFSQPPTSLPSSLSTLSLTSNPKLAGNLPQSVCSNPVLGNCDLRGTLLSGGNATTPSISPNNGTSSNTTSGTSPTTTFCGSCRFS